MRQDSMTSRYKPSHTHGIAAILLPILSGLYFRWLGREESLVRNQGKTLWLLFLLWTSFIDPSRPYKFHGTVNNHHTILLNSSKSPVVKYTALKKTCHSFYRNFGFIPSMLPKDNTKLVKVNSNNDRQPLGCIHGLLKTKKQLIRGQNKRM